mgnify:CR=1 FL=1
MTDALERLITILNQERAAYQSISDMAAHIGVPYDTLYQLLNGNRVRGVNLDVLTTGPIPPNPTEVLNSQKMADLIERQSKMQLMFNPIPGYADAYSWENIAAQFAALFDRIV